jgi:hypothetical protein
MLHMLQWLYTYVSSVCSKYFISFSICMFASVSSGCCICFHAYEVFLGVFFASVSYACFECFSCFVRMLQVFHLEVSEVDLVLWLVFQMHVSCISSAFKHTLQVLHPNISKVDRVLHLCLHFSAASPSSRCLLLLPALVGHPHPLPPLLDAGVATCCSHMLQLLDACMRVRSEGGRERGLPTCSRAMRARVGVHRMQVCGGNRVQACRHLDVGLRPDV